jgi:hypothetical protein
MDNYLVKVFLNCPFDKQYVPIFDAIVFTVQDCGFEVHCASEISNSIQNRLSKIIELIASCHLGIHDLSRTEIDKNTGLPRFNMPFELGLFWGAKEYGDEIQKSKKCLILEAKSKEYQKFISDIAGCDIAAHKNKPDLAIRKVRDWLRYQQSPSTILPDALHISQRYNTFKSDFPEYCRKLKLINRSPLLYIDYLKIVTLWLEENPLS